MIDALLFFGVLRALPGPVPSWVWYCYGFFAARQIGDTIRWWLA